MFNVSKELRTQSSKKDTNVTLDVEQQMVSFRQYGPQAWSDIIIHLDDFHAVVAFFGIIGSFIKCSGFEETIFNWDNVLLKVSKIQFQENREALWRVFVDNNVNQPVHEILQNQVRIWNKTKFLEMKTWAVSKWENVEFGKTPQYYVRYIKLVESNFCHIMLNIIKCGWRYGKDGFRFALQ